MRARIHVHIGIKFNEHHEISVVAYEEFDPEQVFDACNRVGEVEEDLKRLPRMWQRMLRLKLDSAGAPSMSSGDYIELVTADGHILGRHTCLPMGWESTHLPLGAESANTD